MTEVLREMVREARTRVDKTPYEAPKPKPVTPDARRRGITIRALWKQMRLLKKELTRAGYEVGMPHHYTSDKVGKVTASSKESREHKAAFEQRQQARKSRIDAIRRSALLDTLGMSRPELRAYMMRVQKALGEV